MTVFNDTVAETVGVDEGTPITCGVTSTQGLGVSYLIVSVRGQPATVSETIGASEALVAAHGQVIAEILRVSLGQVTNHFAQLGVADVVSLSESLRAGVPISLSETVAVALTQVTQQAIRVIEALALQPAVTPFFIYGQTVSETIRIADAFVRFLGGDLTDGVDFAETMVGEAIMPATLSETVGVAESVPPQLVLRVTAADTIGLDDVDALQMLFSPTIAEGVQLSAAYISPGSSITTWAMNTRTGAVTEYQNYEFNSFARLGNKYIGASSSGLYELLGDDDAGTDIIATIRSGFAQWSGTHLGSFKAAYLAVRGAGSYVLKVLTADGKTYNYTVTAESMKTVKVNMGKGLRARYFAFELVSTGQDFDLDTLEFIPLIADRRV